MESQHNNDVNVGVSSSKAAGGSVSSGFSSSSNTSHNFGLPLDSVAFESANNNVISPAAPVLGNKENTPPALNDDDFDDAGGGGGGTGLAMDEQCWTSSPKANSHQQQEAAAIIHDSLPSLSSFTSGKNLVVNGHDDSNTDRKVEALEERVHELETKLLVLARMLQIHRSAGGGGGSSSSSNELMVLDGTNIERQNANQDYPDTAATKPTMVGELSFGEGDKDEGETTINRPQPIPGCATIPHSESPVTVLGKDQEEQGDGLSGHSESKSPSGERHSNDDGHGGDSIQPITSTDSKRFLKEMSDVFPGENQPNHLISTPKSSIPCRRSNSRSSNGSKKGLPPPPPPELSPNRPIHQRNLSYRVLYEGDEQTYQEQGRIDPNAQASMTLSERRWLGSMFLQQRPQKPQRQASLTLQQPSNVPDENVRHKWLNYLNSFQESTPDVDLQMEEFVKVPGNVESIMAFGFYICVDSFLYIFTILPIRFVWSCLLLLARLASTMSPAKLRLSSAFYFHRRHSYQMIQVFLLYVIYTYILAPISIGKLYHWIRGQAMIKLYVLIAIVEVFDRLMCSMGQDCLDSMYWNAVNRPKSSRMLISVAVVLIYATCHTLLLFLHVATLNVAMNSADQALLTLFISGNFAEIKSTVFKKYNKPALFRLTASDICERFKLGLFLGLVLLLNMCQGMDEGQFISYVRVCAIVWCAELLADWIKHAFITKFNILSAKVYIEYALLLAGDFTGIGHEGVNLDHSHAVVKRIGFAQLPLVCVTVRLLREAFKYATINNELDWMLIMLTRTDVDRNDKYNSWWIMLLAASAAWLFLLALKLALGRLLQRISLQKLRHAPEIIPTPTKKKKS